MVTPEDFIHRLKRLNYKLNKYYHVKVLPSRGFIRSDAVFLCFACCFRVVFQIPKFGDDFFYAFGIATCYFLV